MPIETSSTTALLYSSAADLTVLVYRAPKLYKGFTSVFNIRSPGLHISVCDLLYRPEKNVIFKNEFVKGRETDFKEVRLIVL